MSCINCSQGKSSIVIDNPESNGVQEVVFGGLLVVRVDDLAGGFYVAVSQCNTCKSYWMIESKAGLSGVVLRGWVIRREQGRRLGERTLGNLLAYIKMDSLDSLLFNDYIRDISVRFPDELKKLYEGGVEKLAASVRDWLRVWYFNEVNGRLFPFVESRRLLTVEDSVEGLCVMGDDKLLIYNNLEDRKFDLVCYNIRKEMNEWQVEMKGGNLWGRRGFYPIQLFDNYIVVWHRGDGFDYPTSFTVLNGLGVQLFYQEVDYEKVIKDLSVSDNSLFNLYLCSIFSHTVYYSMRGVLVSYDLIERKEKWRISLSGQFFLGKVMEVGGRLFAWILKGLVRISLGGEVLETYLYDTFPIYISENESFIFKNGMIENHSKKFSIHFDELVGMPVEQGGNLLIPSREVLSFINPRGKVINQYPTDYQPSFNEFDPVSLVGHFGVITRNLEQMMVFDENGEEQFEIQLASKPYRFIAFGGRNLLIITQDIEQGNSKNSYRGWVVDYDNEKIAQIQLPSIKYLCVNQDGKLIYYAEMDNSILIANLT